MTVAGPHAAVEGFGSQEEPAGRSGQERSLIAVLATCAALVFLNRSGIAFLFPWIQPQLGLSHAQLGQLMAATAISWAISSVLFSLASDALGIRPRTVITCCAVGFSAIGALSGMVSSFGALLALRVAMGIFEGPVIPLIQSVVSKASPGRRRGANLGMIIGGSALVGSVLAPPLMMGLAEGVGWRLAFLAVALPGPFVALGVWLVTRPYDSVEADGPAERIGFREALGLARQRNVLIGVVGGITLIGSVMASSSFLPLFLSSLPAFAAETRIGLLTLIGIIHSAGGIAVPALSDKIGRKACLVAACLCSALAPLAIVLIGSSIWWTVPALLLIFGASGAFTLMVYVIPGETVPPRLAATTFAIILFIGEMTGGALAPTLAGWASDHHGLAAAQLVSGAFAGIAFLASLFIQEPRRGVNGSGV